MTDAAETRKRISELVESHPVVLFMKGTRHFPQCGFSATVTQILDELIPKYHTVNVLKDPDIRQGIKEFSSWPTIPQLYVNGKFVGGCDIVREMYIAGELQSALGVEDTTAAPQITLSDAARKALAQASQDETGLLRLSVSSRFEYELSLDEARDGDFHVDAGGVTVLVDRMSAKRADGISIDFTEQGGGGFKIDNPNAPPQVKQLSPRDLKTLMDSGERFVLIDVRTDEERSIASIEGARQLDQATARYLSELDRGEKLVLFCHHGGRSQAAAEQLLGEGFRDVSNVAGGIDAWAREVDPAIARY